MRFDPGPVDSCPISGYDDHDDILFTVSAGSSEMVPDSVTVKATAHRPAAHKVNASLCASFNENKCTKAVVCVYTDAGCMPKMVRV